MVASSIQAQSKSELISQLAVCTAEKDSIQNSLMDLTVLSDSISKEHVAYTEMYNAVKEKVFKDDFDPASMSGMIDSLQAKNSFANAALNDSLSTLQQEISMLNEMAESKEETVSDKTEVVDALKQLKELLDSGILSQEEFDAKKTVLLEKLWALLP